MKNGGTDHPPFAPKLASLNPVPGGDSMVTTTQIMRHIPIMPRVRGSFQAPNSSLSTSLCLPAAAPSSMNDVAMGARWQCIGRLSG